MIGGLPARKGALAVCDQALVSAATLVVALVLARGAAISEYGSFVLGISVLIFLQAVQSALVTGPMMVLTSGRSGDEQRQYCSSLAMMQVVICLAMAVGCMGCAWMGAAIGWSPSLVAAIGAMGLMLPFIQLQEFTRRVMMAHAAWRGVLVNDLVCYGMRIGAIVLLSLAAGRSITAASAFIILGLCSAVGAGVGTVQIRGWLGPWSGWGAIRRHAIENWVFGRWLLTSSLLTVGYMQSIYWLLAATKGESAVAAFDGPRLIIAPCMLLIAAWGNLVGPLAAREYCRAGVAPAWRRIVRAGAPLLAVIGGVGVVLAAFPGALLNAVLGERFAHCESSLLVWLAVVMVMGATTVASTLFHATRRPRLGTLSRLCACLASISFAGVLVPAWGAWGAIMTRLAAEISMGVAVAAMVWVVLRTAREESSDVGANGSQPATA